MLSRCIAALLMLSLASCEAGVSFTQGPGYDLNYARASKASSNLDGYIGVMCHDAGLVATTNGLSTCQLTPGNYRPLLQAGFGEIRLGCRAYIQFLFEERLRDRQFKSGNSAIQAFISGVLTLESAGARLFSYLILSSSAANAFYDASRLDPLQGLTLQNILKIVDERQAAFEKAAYASDITSRPQVIRAWREFQWICTPLSISTDFNALAVASVEGRKVDFQAEAQRTMESIAPTIRNVRNFDSKKPLDPTSPAPAAPNAINDLEKRLWPDQIKKIQSALCVPPEGVFGPTTRKAIDEWRSGASDASEAQTEKGLQPNEFDVLWKGQTCIQLGFKSAFERQLLHDTAWANAGATQATVKLYKTDFIKSLADKLKVTVPDGETTITDEMRNAIQKQREALQLKGDYLDYQLFKKLY